MQLVFATNNLNKIKEVQALMPKHITLLSLEAIGCFEDIPETQNSIRGNAIQKAEFVKNRYGYDCFADDTGLEVDALDGEPGIYSARYAGEQRNANDNMNALLEALGDNPNRSAHFKTVMALQIKNEQHVFIGICEGEITASKQGENGFGYDPIFKPNGYVKTFAEMDLNLKNTIGHRGKAVSQLVGFLNSYNTKKLI